MSIFSYACLPSMWLGEGCVLIFCPFLIVWSVLLLSFKSCLDILDAGLLSDKWFVEIFSQSVACFQSLNPVFHRESCHFNDISLLIFFFPFINPAFVVLNQKTHHQTQGHQKTLKVT